jgi:hypothetical protein
MSGQNILSPRTEASGSTPASVGSQPFQAPSRNIAEKALQGSTPRAPRLEDLEKIAGKVEWKNTFDNAAKYLKKTFIILGITSVTALVSAFITGWVVLLAVAVVCALLAVPALLAWGATNIIAACINYSIAQHAKKEGIDQKKLIELIEQQNVAPPHTLSQDELQTMVNQLPDGRNVKNELNRLIGEADQKPTYKEKYLDVVEHVLQEEYMLEKEVLDGVRRKISKMVKEYKAGIEKTQQAPFPVPTPIQNYLTAMHNSRRAPTSWEAVHLARKATSELHEYCQTQANTSILCENLAILMSAPA